MTLAEFFKLPKAEREVIMLEVAQRAIDAQRRLMVGEGGAVPGPTPSAVAAPIKRTARPPSE